MESMNILPCTSKQLNLDVVLLNGQSFSLQKFRWKKVVGDSNSSFLGVAKQRVWKIWRRDDKNIEFQIVARFSNNKEYIYENDSDVLRDYFQLEVDLEELYCDWALKDEHFNMQVSGNTNLLSGIRILKQDLLETLFSFICSSNNNISRISGLVEKLCQFYGSKSLNNAFGSDEFYDFPKLIQLQDGFSGMEARLRNAGFGYRAKYIAQTVAKLTEKELGGDVWLESLRDQTYEYAKIELMDLPGIGPKVADCICLMGLQKHHVVPVDTHVFQITCQLYGDQVKALKAQKQQKKTLCKGMHEEIGRFYVEKFGLYAGWAHSVLFSNRLRHLKTKTKI